MKFLISAFLSLLLALGAIGGLRACAADTPPHPRMADPGDFKGKVGEVGRFGLVNDAGRAAAPRIISFGQIFRPGEVAAGATLEVLVDGKPLPTQMDPKAFNLDGSVRHAILTIETPQLAAGARAEATIVSRSARAGAQAAARKIAPPAVVVDILETGGKRRARVELAKVVRERGPVGAPWLSGPLAQEHRYVADVDGGLQIVFDVFTPVRGPARVDVAFHLDRIGTRRNDVQTYDVELLVDGKTAYRAQEVRHYPFSNWHTVLWTDSGQALRIVPDLDMLRTAAATPRYVDNVPINPKLLDEIRRAGREGASKPLGRGLVSRNMPGTGGRMDIGPLPTWAVVDLLHGSEATRRALLASADAAGSIPWHLRDGDGRPLTIDDHPRLWLDLRGGEVPGVLPDAFDLEFEGWRIDDAHQPLLTYLPYLLTGSQYYRDELAQQAAFVLLSYDPGFRGEEQGLIIGRNGEAWQQVRGLAWSLRTLATAAYALPSDDPLQAYFDSKLRANLAKLVELYVEERKLKSAGEIEGWMPGAYSPEDMTAPWQQAFLATVLNWANDMGYTDAGRVVAWMSNFLSGLFTNADKGFNPDRGAAYRLPIEGDGGERIRTWRRLYNESEMPEKDADEVDEMWGDYGWIMRAGVGAAYSVTGSPQAAEAYRFIGERMRRMREPVPTDPTFAIAPSRPLPSADK